jgi:hypothetical protein
MLIQDGHQVEPGQVDMARPWWWAPVREGLGLEKRIDQPPYEWDVSGWNQLGVTTDTVPEAFRPRGGHRS